MPGSPVEVKIQSRSSPPNMPPLPPVNAGGPRPVSFTPAARKAPNAACPGPALASREGSAHRDHRDVSAISQGTMGDAEGGGTGAFLQSCRACRTLNRVCNPPARSCLAPALLLVLP